MKFKHLIATVGTILVAGAAIEAFYKHPTLGNGLQAFLAAVNLGELL